MSIMKLVVAPGMHLNEAAFKQTESSMKTKCMLSQFGYIRGMDFLKDFVRCALSKQNLRRLSISSVFIPTAEVLFKLIFYWTNKCSIGQIHLVSNVLQ